MNLSEVFNKLTSIGEFNGILANKVIIAASRPYEEVAIEGYEGAVATDFIGHRILAVLGEETEDTNKLATLFAEKVILPLANLREPLEQRRLLYQLAATKNAGSLLPEVPGQGPLIALRHLMILGLLDRKYAFWS